MLKLKLQYFGHLMQRAGLLPQWLSGKDSACSTRNSQESSSAPQFESINSSALNLPYGPNLTSIHDFWKKHSFDQMALCQKSDVSAFHRLSRFVITFLPRASVLILQLQSLSTVILEPRKTKSVTVSTFPPSICHEVMGLDVMILVFEC